MERHPENITVSPCNRGNPVLDRLHAPDSAHAGQPVPGAEQQGVAQPSRELPPSGFAPFRNIAEQELAALESSGVGIGWVRPWAEDHCHLYGEINRAAEIAVQRVEATGAVLQKDRRWRALARVAALISKVVPLRRIDLRFAQEPLPAVGDAGGAGDKVRGGSDPPGPGSGGGSNDTFRGQNQSDP